MFYGRYARTVDVASLALFAFIGKTPNCASCVARQQSNGGCHSCHKCPSNGRLVLTEGRDATPAIAIEMHSLMELHEGGGGGEEGEGGGSFQRSFVDFFSFFSLEF